MNVYGPGSVATLESTGVYLHNEGFSLLTHLCLVVFYALYPLACDLEISLSTSC